MINKLMLKIEEHDNYDELSDDDISETISDNIQSNNNLEDKPVINGLLQDIKFMINNNESSNPKNILEMSKNISTKYQNLVDNYTLDKINKISRFCLLIILE